MKGIFKGILVLVILAAVVGVSLYFLVPMNNNLILGKFSRQLEETKLPENTEIVAFDKRCGKLYGEEKGLDFLSVIIVKSDLTITEMKSFFENKIYFNAKDSQNEMNVYIYNMKGDSINDLIPLDEEVRFNELFGLSDYSNYYAIILIDADYPPGLDHRGY